MWLDSHSVLWGGAHGLVSCPASLSLIKWNGRESLVTLVTFLVFLCMCDYFRAHNYLSCVQRITQLIDMIILGTWRVLVAHVRQALALEMAEYWTDQGRWSQTSESLTFVRSIVVIPHSHWTAQLPLPSYAGLASPLWRRPLRYGVPVCEYGIPF